MSGGSTRLVVQGYFAAFRSSLPRGNPGKCPYRIVRRDETIPSPDVQWGDWDAEGRLLVATTDGRLQVRDGSRDGYLVRWEVDLSRVAPEPLLPHEEGRRW